MTPDVLAPTTLGPVRLRNRVLKSATFEGRTPDGVVSDRLIEFHTAFARGGIGMTTVAYLAVAPEGRTHRAQIHVREEALPGLTRLAEAVHAEGAAINGQLGHAGPVANGRSNGVHALTASRMPSPLSMQMMHSATEADLTRITRQYATAARLLVRTGFDSLEIHMAHSYLISAFLAPGLNRRKDRWGGSLENRARLARQVARAVRDEIGSEAAVLAKISVSDGFRGGLTTDEALEFASWLESDGTLDALELSGGSSLMNPLYLFRGDAPRKEFAAAMPPLVRLGLRTVGRGFLKEYPYQEAFFLGKARRFRAALRMPLVLVGGISRLETMRQAMAEGFEYVAIGRALLRDPLFLQRAATGAPYDACIHCNRCMPTIYDPGGTHCPVKEEA